MENLDHSQCALRQINGVRIARVKHLGADESREGKRGETAIIQSIRIHMPDVDLDRGMVLGSYDPVGGRAAGTNTKQE